MFSSVGIFHYGPGLRAAVNVCPDLIAYYRSLIPKYHNVHRQRYDGHITVVRINVEVPLKMNVWGKHQGAQIRFDYDPYVHHEGVYWFLNAFSEQIGDIREELGLPRFRFADKPWYHMSIGNTKQ